MAHASVLFRVKRYRDAKAKLRALLADDPAFAHGHVMLSRALYCQKRYADALQEAEAAICLAPDDPEGHYWCAQALAKLDKVDKAMSAIREAMRLNPQNARYHAVVSFIHTLRNDWEKALAVAEAGLCIDPTNIRCSNFRALCLVNLERHDEAEQTLVATLARDPEQASLHLSRGLVTLHRDDYEQSASHFREALRLNPMSDAAKWGLCEALDAQSPIYHRIIRYRF